MTTQWKEVSDPGIMQTKPVVSVAMLAYNHAAFLAEAIEGVVMQKTAFPIELVIGVDVCSDNTLEIALRYQELHPRLIRVLVPEKRLGMHRNCYLTLQACRGKYMAVCEGDDFWIAPHKVATQVQTLEGDLTLAGCFHDCFFLKQKTNLKRPRIGNRKIDPVPDTASLIEEKNITSCSMLFRNCISIPELKQLTKHILQIDYVICLLISEYGRWKYLAEPMAVYRAHDGGIWSAASTVEKCRENLRFLNGLTASKWYPDLRPSILAATRNIHRSLGIALAKDKCVFESMYHFGRSIGPTGKLQDAQVRASKYWRALAHGVSSQVGLDAPLARLWHKLHGPKANV